MASRAIEKAEKRFRKVIIAVAVVSEHFAPFVAGEYPPGTEDHILQRTSKIQELSGALVWAGNWVKEEQEAGRRLIQSEWPKSQQKSDLAMFFAVMLCNRFSQTLDQPLYDHVATITEVMFAPKKTIGGAAIRARVERDQARRAQPHDSPS